MLAEWLPAGSQRAAGGGPAVVSQALEEAHRTINHRWEMSATSTVRTAHLEQGVDPLGEPTHNGVPRLMVGPCRAALGESRRGVSANPWERRVQSGPTHPGRVDPKKVGASIKKNTFHSPGKKQAGPTDPSPSPPLREGGPLP